MGNNKKQVISRRKFMSDAGKLAIGSSLLLGASFPSQSKPLKDKLSDVILVRDKEVLDGNGNPKADVVLDMLDQAVSRLTGKKDALQGWKTFIKPEDILGIKTNVWNPIGTTKQVEDAIKKRAMEAGVAEKNIAIQDRGISRSPFFKKATALINARPMRTHHWSGVGSLIKNYVMFVPDPFN